MKTYTFYREFYSTEPGWEIDLYRSNDINGSWTSWRGCLDAVAVMEGLIDPYLYGTFHEGELEEILLENSIYACVEDV